MQSSIQILIVAVLASVACVLPGIFLVLRGVALMSDAISHAVLLGIALMFLWVHNLDSPLLLVGAALAGLATVFLTETVIQTRRLKEDAAIGIVFPLFFSCGVILISLFARDVHLDVDMVILGEIAFAPFNRFYVWGYDLGPSAFYSLGTIVLLNAGFIYLFYKELKLSIFDHDFAYVAGFSPVLLYYALMFLTSITAVGAFDVVGSIVVVALMITPPATASLLVSRLEQMIAVSIILSIAAALFGYAAAAWFDVSIAGSIATVSGLFFLLMFLFSPTKGLLAQMYRRYNQRKKLLQQLHQ
jgi:manganese/zinc/iron transport system permease protein